MSKIIKLSKSDWMRIGREAGYIKGAQLDHMMHAGSIFLTLKSVLARTIENMGCLGGHDQPPEGLAEDADKLIIALDEFNTALKNHGLECSFQFKDPS